LATASVLSLGRVQAGGTSPQPAPPQLTSSIGRERELAKVKRLLGLTWTG